MSHDHTVIEPAAGLTVLVGPNNCGKSAVVAALQILCHNENSTYVLRHGERECSVKIETDDGHTIEWRRKNTPSYVIDGHAFDRLRGSGLPDELHNALRLPQVDTGGDIDFDVHFGTQKSPIFLLSGSAANAARFFASSSDAIRLVTMQKRHKDKLSDAQREKNRLEAESKQVNAELELLEPVVALDHRLAAASLAYDEVIEGASRLEAAERAEAAIRAQAVTVAQYSAQADTLRRLSPPPEILPTEPLETLIAALVAANSRQKAAAAQAGALVSLAQPPTMAPIEPLQNLIIATEREEEERKAAVARLGTLLSLRSPPELFDVLSLDRLATSMATWSEHRRRSESERESLSRLSPPPQLADVETLRRLVERLVASAAEVLAWKRRNSALEAVSGPPTLADESELAGMIAFFNEATSQVARWEQTLAVLAPMASVPPPVETGAICELLGRLEGYSAHVSACKMALQATESGVAEAASMLRSKVADGLCPVCGNQVDPDRVVALAATGLGGHEHG
jgi:exonuclease SbcC